MPAPMPDPLAGHRVVRRAFEFVGHAHRVEHAPQHVQLELQDIQHAFLCLAGPIVLQGDPQAVLDVAPGLGQATAEILVAGRLDPRIVARPAVQPRLVDLRGEEFGQRTARRLLPTGATGEVDVGVDGEAHAGQHPLLGEHLLALQAHRFRQAQPGLDAARLAGGAVVVEDALDPLAADLAVGTVGQDRRVLQRDVDLVVETVRHPALDLFATGTALVHRDMERMVDMVVASLVAQRRSNSARSMAARLMLAPTAGCACHPRPLRCHWHPVRRVLPKRCRGWDWCC